MSESNTSETAQVTEANEPKSAIVPATVKNALSFGEHTVMRDTKTGKFARKRSKLDQELKSSEKLEREIQQVLDSPVMIEGKPLLDPKTNKPISMHTAVEMNLLEICRTSQDPKMLSGASKLLDILFTRAHGRAKESPANRDALVTHGITTVILTIPPEIRLGEMKASEKPKQPSWASAEVVSTNKPQKKADVIEADYEELPAANAN